jgi:SAM-dependent methyltransferase
METDMNNTLLNATGFYDSISSFYDEMTSFNRRVESERNVLAALVERFQVHTAVDMGCGTGIESLALAANGVAVTGIDPSQSMLLLAQRHADQRNADIKFIHGDFFYPGLSTIAPVDMLICTGNTLPHLDSIDRLPELLRLWKSCLSPGGRIVVQLLNYDEILAARERIIAVRRLGRDMVVRFYDFTEPRITFNVLHIVDTPGAPEHTLASTHLTPVEKHDLQDACAAAGISDMEWYGSLTCEPLTGQSRDIVLICR